MTTALSPPSRKIMREAIGFEPTGAEQLAILETPKRFLAISGGEQSGKSFIMGEFLSERVPETKGPGLYWLVGRRYVDTEKEFDYILDNLQRAELVADFTRRDSDQPRQILLHDGTIIRTMSVAETANISREAPDGILGCEAGQLPEEAYYKLFLRAIAGHGWLVLGGTLERSSPWYRELIKNWRLPSDPDMQSFILPSWTNTHLYPGGREDPEIKRAEAILPPDIFEERMAAVPRIPSDVVFGRDFVPEKHIREIEYIPGLPVSLAVDPGYNQAAHANLAIQLPPDAPIHVFDEIYDDSLYTTEMIEVSQQREWWADVQDGVIDIQATKPQQAQLPPIHTWIEKAGLHLRSRNVPIMDGIDRFKSFLRFDPRSGEPLMVISPRCRGLLSELGYVASPLTGKFQPYTWKIDRTGTIVGQMPRNLYNHSTKALTYWLVDRFGYVTSTRSNVVRLKRWS